MLKKQEKELWGKVIGVAALLMWGLMILVLGGHCGR